VLFRSVAGGQAAAAVAVYEGGQIDGRHWRWQKVDLSELRPSE
jgi:hypothetical protein